VSAGDCRPLAKGARTAMDELVRIGEEMGGYDL
jgi:hypothetical protein